MGHVQNFSDATNSGFGKMTTVETATKKILFHKTLSLLLKIETLPSRTSLFRNLLNFTYPPLRLQYRLRYL